MIYFLLLNYLYFHAIEGHEWDSGLDGVVYVFSEGGVMMPHWDLAPKATWSSLGKPVALWPDWELSWGNNKFKN